MRIAGSPPRWSQTAAATMPPGRTTRRISRNRVVGLGHEMEHQEREGAVEPAVRERDGAGIALARS